MSDEDFSLPEREAKYFEVFSLDDLNGTPFAGSLLIVRIARKAPKTIPADILKFKGEIVRAAAKINRFTERASENQREYVQELAAVARSGLEDGDLVVARESFNEFKSQFSLNEGVPIRARYLRRLSVIGAMLAVPAVLCGFSGTWFNLTNAPAPFPLFVPAGWILFGTVLGLLLAAYTRNREIKFENIGQFDPDNLTPLLRIMFLIIIAMVAAIMLSNRWVIVGLTDAILLNDFMKNNNIAILLGMLIGYADPEVAGLAMNTLESIKPRSKGGTAH